MFREGRQSSKCRCMNAEDRMTLHSAAKTNFVKRSWSGYLEWTLQTIIQAMVINLHKWALILPITWIACLILTSNSLDLSTEGIIDICISQFWCLANPFALRWICLEWRLSVFSCVFSCFYFNIIIRWGSIVA